MIRVCETIRTGASLREKQMRLALNLLLGIFVLGLAATPGIAADLVTVGVIAHGHEGGDPNTSAYLMPLLSYRGGAWTNSELLDIEGGGPEGGKEHLSERQHAYLDALLKSTFHVQGQPGVSLNLKEKTSYIYGVKIALAGTAVGLPEYYDTVSEYIAVSDERASIRVDRATRYIGPEDIVAEIVERVVKDAKEIEGGDGFLSDPGPKFNPNAYGKLDHRESIFVQAHGGDALVWNSFMLPYPLPERTPNISSSASGWSGIYSSIVHVRDNKILWDECSTIASMDTTKKLLGATDLNRDGIPELIFFERGLEYSAYTAYTLEKGKLVLLVALDLGLM